MRVLGEFTNVDDVKYAMEYNRQSLALVHFVYDPTGLPLDTLLSEGEYYRKQLVDYLDSHYQDPYATMTAAYRLQRLAQELESQGHNVRFTVTVSTAQN